MSHKKQIVSILVLSFLLGLVRFIFINDSNFTLIKKERIIKEITSFNIPEVMNQPMAITLEFSKHLFDNKSAIFIDARDVEDYDSGHIKNAVNIPYDSYEEYSEIIDKLNIESIYVIYCNGEECSLSMDLGEYLFNELLFEKILIFEGGWPMWRDANFPS